MQIRGQKPERKRMQTWWGRGQRTSTQIAPMQTHRVLKLGSFRPCRPQGIREERIWEHMKLCSKGFSEKYWN